MGGRAAGSAEEDIQLLLSQDAAGSAAEAGGIQLVLPQGTDKAGGDLQKPARPGPSVGLDDVRVDWSLLVHFSKGVRGTGFCYGVNTAAGQDRVESQWA